MEESEIQKQVSDAIIKREDDSASVSLTDNERCVVIDLGDVDSLYTAEEARHLAAVIDQNAIRTDNEKWDEHPTELVMYLYDLADVVDGIIDAETVEKKWSGDTDFDQSDLHEKLREVNTRPHHP